MKQLKVSVIVSRLINSIKKNLFSSRRIITSVFSLTVILIILFSLVFQFNSTQLLVAIVLVVAFDFALITLLHKSRNKELDSIKDIIKKIRENLLLSPNEINLDNDLIELEEEIKSMYLKNQNDIAYLKKLEQVRTEFLGNVSHELRTPIFAIQGYIETLLEGAINDEKVNRTFLQKAIQHTINLNNLLNDLIDISMIESGKMLMSFRYFNVHEFLENILNEFSAHAANKNLHLTLLKVNPSLQLFGDKLRLKQVLSNLIMNAIRYTEIGSIEVGVVEEEKFGEIFVKDTGIGIPPNEIGRIFERFYRIDKDRSRELGGTGLGLAIVKHIIEAHGSRIEVRSQVGEGSEFFFRLKK